MLRTLVVEDEYPLRFAIAETLRQAGYEPIEARDGLQALHILMHHTVDIILTDVHMPGLDGSAYLKEIAARHPLIPLIIFGARPQTGELGRVPPQADVCYLPKPFGKQQLIDALQSLSHSSQSAQAGNA